MSLVRFQSNMRTRMLSSSTGFPNNMSVQGENSIIVFKSHSYFHSTTTVIPYGRQLSPFYVVILLGQSQVSRSECH